MEDALRLYRRIEAKQDELKAKYEQENGKYEKAMKQVEVVMLQLLQGQGVTQMKIDGIGLVKQVDKRRYGCADWGLFYPWVVANDRPDLFQKRLLDSAMDLYLQDTGGLPPACKVETTRTITVLKG
jgi:hypothetical protein